MEITRHFGETDEELRERIFPGRKQALALCKVLGKLGIKSARPHTDVTRLKGFMLVRKFRIL